MACLLLALFSALGYFHIEALFIDFFCGLVKGLIGYGFWLVPPALLLTSYILAFHRGRPVRLRVTCALLLPLLFSCIVHGLLGRVLPWDAALVKTLWAAGEELSSGGVLGGALYRALAVSELNAAMGRVVAAPTAGSCGILPAAVLTMQEKGCSERDCVMALFTASAVGMVITANASVAGAQGGCQAECGSAAAMAAAAIVELAGGSPRQAAHAVAIALKNILGLVCDPVAGLVEIPCIKRNASGVAGAFVAAELALAGIESAIPADEVIVAMKKVGDAMSPALKETAEGGLAATPTARRLYEQVFGRPADGAGCTGCGGCGGL